MRSSLEIYDPGTGQSRVVLQSDDLIEAPNWCPLGGSLLVSRDGRLFRVPLDAPELLAVDTGDQVRCNNDHGFSPDGKWIAFSSHRERGAEIFVVAAEGGEPRVVSTDAPSWFHGWSPDGSRLVYVAARGERRVIDVYTVAVEGGPEVRLTQGEGQCDGPEYSADGSRIYYNCDRGGHAQIWVMAADGTGQRKLFADAMVNWFPHPSPDGTQLLYLAYPSGTEGHPRDLDVALCLMDLGSGERRRVLTFTGGQGTINGPCWAPDGSAIAYVRYQVAD